tara:strand:+ start:226 stop:1413 length:1188 start_codon:yes stop_codon:yes gene_type:complete
MQKMFFNPTSDTTISNTAGDKWTAKPDTKASEKIKYSFKNNIVVSVKIENGETTWGTASTGPITDYNEKLDNTTLKLSKHVDPKLPKAQNDLINQVKESTSLRPEVLKMKDLTWKYLMRSAIRGKNIMMTGPSGCGKTMAAKSVVNALNRPDFYFNLGATQDPRSTLIGNTHFNKKDGTYFSEALFVKAIQTPNAVILLDELSRAHPDAHNILMTVLDQGQRYLRLDEADGSPTIEVAKGVTFIATANIGNEYTATRVMDRALLDRFIIVEMDVLDKEEEQSLIEYMFPNLPSKNIQAIADIVGGTRQELKSEAPRISTHISTRNSLEMASLIYDGFTLEEASQVCIYPQYDASGGIDSERTFVKQLVQKWSYDPESLDSGNDELFNIEDTDMTS